MQLSGFTERRSGPTWIVMICVFLLPVSRAVGQGQLVSKDIPVEIVASASEYVPSYSTVTQPGHSLTNCSGNTQFFGSFESSGTTQSFDSIESHSDSGTVSGTAETDTRCKTAFTPPTQTTIATYRKVNYTIAKSDQALYMVACVQTWKPSAATRLRAAMTGVTAAAQNDGSGPTQEQAVLTQGSGNWTDCPAFSVGTAYTLVINSASDARLDGTVASKKPMKLDYLGSTALPPLGAQSAQLQAPQQAEARVHITSTPTGGEIYMDGKFFGNTPSDITLPSGEHALKIVLGSKEWSRTVEVTSGQVTIHAEIPKE